jgi:hypothetical protein
MLMRREIEIFSNYLGWRMKSIFAEMNEETIVLGGNFAMAVGFWS